MFTVRDTLYAWLYVTVTRLSYVKSTAPAGTAEADYQKTIVSELIAELLEGDPACPGHHFSFDAPGDLAHDISTWVADARLKTEAYSAVANRLQAATSAPWPLGSPDHPDFRDLDGSFQ